MCGCRGTTKDSADIWASFSWLSTSTILGTRGRRQSCGEQMSVAAVLTCQCDSWPKVTSEGRTQVISDVTSLSILSLTSSRTPHWQNSLLKLGWGWGKWGIKGSTFKDALTLRVVPVQGWAWSTCSALRARVSLNFAPSAPHSPHPSPSLGQG